MATPRSGALLANKKKSPLPRSNVIITAEEIVDEECHPLRPQPHTHPRADRQMLSATFRTARTPLTPRAITIGTMSSISTGIRSAKTPEAIKAWLDEWVYGVKDADEYWQKLGEETHERLKVKPAFASPVNYGKY